MTIVEYQDATRRAINNLAKLFKPKEVQTLLDFLRTVTQEDIDEKKDPTP